MKLAATRACALAIACVSPLALVACGGQHADVPSASTMFGPREALSGDDPAGFARASAPREFEFPADHGPHPEFRTEWWYATGNLWTESGARYGFQFTIFRNALVAEVGADRASAWAARDVWFAHFGLTDVAGDTMFGAERFARGGALGLAGARVAPGFEVWLEDWRLDELPAATSPDPAPFAVRLRAATAEIAIDLELRAVKPVVLQGERGLSRKSDEAGNASYYYSFTRLATVGSIRVRDESMRIVRGTSWFDREWSTSALAANQVGWDWFALQLDDGRDLMFYRLRRDDGSSDPQSSGVVVAEDGSATSLRADMVELDVLATWRSANGAVYPISWRLRIEELGIDLGVRAVVNDQEHADFVIRYWEGAVDVVDPLRDVPVGVGYVEITGR